MNSLAAHFPFGASAATTPLFIASDGDHSRERVILLGYPLLVCDVAVDFSFGAASHLSSITPAHQGWERVHLFGLPLIVSDIAS